MRSIIIIVTRESDSPEIDVLAVCTSWAEAEHEISDHCRDNDRAADEVDAFATEHDECDRSVLRAASDYLRDVIARQSLPHASMINRDAPDHLAQIESELSRVNEMSAEERAMNARA